MGLTPAQQLQLLQHQVASSALSGAGVEEIEQTVIAPADCREQDKAALRLYAWSFLSRFEQRRIALDHLCEALREEPAALRALPGFDSGGVAV